MSNQLNINREGLEMGVFTKFCTVSALFLCVGFASAETVEDVCNELAVADSPDDLDGQGAFLQSCLEGAALAELDAAGLRCAFADIPEDGSVAPQCEGLDESDDSTDSE